jgi:hypothetical protein
MTDDLRPSLALGSVLANDRCSWFVRAAHAARRIYARRKGEGMDPYKDKLEPEQVDALVVYVFCAQRRR